MTELCKIPKKEIFLVKNQKWKDLELTSPSTSYKILPKMKDPTKSLRTLTNHKDTYEDQSKIKAIRTKP